VTKLDTHINAGFADFEVCYVILFASLPSQKKASKSSQITFLCNLYFIIKDIHQKSPHSTRFNILSSFCAFMEKVEREANYLISASLNDLRVAVLRKKQVSAAETKTKYLEDGDKVHQHFSKCVKCEHSYVNLPPLMIASIVSICFS